LTLGIKIAGKACAAFHDENVRREARHVQVDEIWSGDSPMTICEANAKRGGDDHGSR